MEIERTFIVQKAHGRVGKKRLIYFRFFVDRDIVGSFLC